MSKLLAIAIVLVSLSAQPASAASSPCAVVHDPAGDALGGIDLTGVAMERAHDALIVTVGTAPGVRKQSAGTSAVARWRAGASEVAVHAERSGAGWTFSWRSGTVSGAAEGDARSTAITVVLPLAVAANGASELTDISARSVRTTGAKRTLTTDEAPDSATGLRTFPLDGTCPTADFAAGCTLAPGVTFAAGARAIEVTVSTHWKGDGRWEVAWVNLRAFNGRERQEVVITRAAGVTTFLYAAGDDEGHTVGTSGSSSVSAVVPRAELSLHDGVRLEQITVLRAPPGPYDLLPTEGTSRDWVVGPGCDTLERQGCPVVLDKPGDARYVEVDEIQHNHASLDVLAVGAAPRADSLTLSVRVTDLASADPIGADVTGWTVSWLAGELRMFAQAERSDGGVTFRYGARKADGDAPAGPTFQGAAATGRLDGARSLIAIDVPRWLMADDGARVEGFGATAWALTGRDTAAAYLVWDETGSRAYHAGVVCPA